MAELDDETKMKHKASECMKDKTKPLIDRLRYACLARGIFGIAEFGRKFRSIDDDGNRTLSFGEFKKAIAEFGLCCGSDELKALFDEFDKDGSGSISYDEFLITLRGEMNDTRKNLVDKVFKKFDKTNDFVVTPKDLKGVYNVKKHPKFLSGEWTETKCCVEFLSKFQSGSLDGEVELEEFRNYYTGISASIDNDAYFDLMMRNSWQI